MYTNPPQVPARVSPLLSSDEHVLWTGAPDPSKILQKSDWLLIPFSLIWAGGVAFWEITAIRGGAPTFFVLWGIPFVLIGLYFVVGRFAVRARALRTTTYALTNKRAFVVTGGRVQAVPVASGPSSVEQTGDASHVTVTYGTATAGRMVSDPVSGTSRRVGADRSGQVTFENVTDVDGLLAAIRQAVSGTR